MDNIASNNCVQATPGCALLFVVARVSAAPDAVRCVAKNGNHEQNHFRQPMSNIFYENPAWAIGIAIVLFGIIAGHRLGTRRDKIAAFNRAATEFSDSFHRELREIYPTPTNWPQDIDAYLRTRFATLSEAVAKFQRHLPKRKRRAIDRDWFRFYCSTGRDVDRNCQCYHHYMGFSGVSVENGKTTHYDTTDTYKATFKQNVDCLLQYAKHK